VRACDALQIVCPQCSAQYDFPVEAVPDEGLRAKCAACNFIMQVARSGEVSEAAHPPAVEAPTPEAPAYSGYLLVSRKSSSPLPVDAVAVSISPHTPAAPAPVPAGSAPLGRAQKRPAPPPQAGAPDVVVRTDGRADRVVVEQPKVILNLDDIGTPAPALIERVSSAAEVFAPAPVDVPDARTFNPFRRAASWVMLFGTLGVAGYFVVLPQLAPPPPPRVAAPAAVVETPLFARGVLQIEDLRLEWLPKKAGAVVHGTLVNRTGLTQSAIALTASLLKSGVPKLQRVVACCDALTLDAATLIAATPDHAHLAPRLSLSGRPPLADGERRAFSVVFPGPLVDTVDLTPRVEVKFNEPLRTP